MNALKDNYVFMCKSQSFKIPAFLLYGLYMENQQYSKIPIFLFEKC